MTESVSQYLETLKAELAGSDAAIVQDALSDAEDHLRTALDGQRQAQPDASEAELLPAIIEDFGTPAEVAAAYHDLDTYLSPGYGRKEPAQKRNLLAAFFGIIADPHAWGSLLYMILSLVTGIIYFTWVVTGLSLSAGFIILIIGLPFFALFMLSVRGIALIEGRIVEGLLGVQMPRRPLFFDKNLGWWDKFKTLVGDGRTWLSMLYMVLMLALGTLYFSLFVTIISVVLSFVGAPVLNYFFGPMIFEFPSRGLITSVILVAPDWMMPIFSVLGILAIFPVMHLAKLIGRLHGKFAKFMLVRS